VWTKAEVVRQVVIRDKSLRNHAGTELKAAFTATTGIDGVYTNEEARTLVFLQRLIRLGTGSHLTAREGYALMMAGCLLASDTPYMASMGTTMPIRTCRRSLWRRALIYRGGVVLDTISNLRVAPTIAKILNVSLPAAKQPPLDEILR